MAIQAIDQDGNLEWKCPHIPEDADKPCGQTHTHHISHEAIKWQAPPLGAKPEHHSVSLPACPACGAQTFIRVYWSERELKAPNNWVVWEPRHEEIIQDLAQKHAEAEPGTHKDVLAYQIADLEKIKQAGGIHTNSHAMALRHMEFAKQLHASGKTPPTTS